MRAKKVLGFTGCGNERTICEQLNGKRDPAETESCYFGVSFECQQSECLSSASESARWKKHKQEGLCPNLRLHLNIAFHEIIPSICLFAARVCACSVSGDQQQSLVGNIQACASSDARKKVTS